ncbi:MAG: tetratricopeptide repeat protein [Acidobacteriota bacterium]
MTGELRGTVICQSCGAPNADDREFCDRCHQKLLVLSGASHQDEEGFFEEDPDESFSFDEHLLERISILEEAVKRTADSVRQLFGVIQKQERGLLMQQTGLTALREILERKGLLAPDEWTELWQAQMDFQLLALEKKERFTAVRDRVAALFEGERRSEFLAFLDDAEAALAASDVERGTELLEAAHRLDRNNYELSFYLGETCFNEGDSARALMYFGRVLEAVPDHYEGLVYSGVLLHEAGSNERAEELLRRAVALYADAFLPNFSLGAVVAAQGNLARAVVYLERAVALEPVPQALFLYGRCLYEMGKLTPAIRQLQEAVRLDPALDEAHHLLGLAYLDRHWNRKALAAFREAQRLNPNRLRYQDLVRYLSGPAGAPLPGVEGEAGEWLERAEEQMDADQPKQALECFRRALALDPDHPTLLISYGLLCLELNQQRETEWVTRKVLALDTGEPGGEMLKATACAALIGALRGQGRLREGNRLGRQLLDEGHSNFSKTIAYYEMAYNLAEMEEDLDEALDFARQSLELAPDELKQFPLAALGWVHYKRREYDRAIDYLARSSDLGPSATTYRHLGMALLAEGSEQEARDVLAKARRLDDRGEGLEQKMMECMRDSARLFERVRRQGR